MSRYLIFLIVICALSASAFSQAVTSASSPLGIHFPSVPKGEVYGGIQWEDFDVHNFLAFPSGVTVPRTNFRGFHTSASFGLNRWLEVEGDLGRSGEYYKGFFVTGDKLSIFTLTFLGGPRVHYRMGPLTQFAHVLLGIDHLTSGYTSPGSAATNSSTNPFTIAIGGGTSFHVSRSFGVEAAADYIRASNSGAPLNDIRASFGPVFYFGGAKPAPAPYEQPTPAPATPRAVNTTPPPAPQCIEYLVDAQGNEWCLVHAGQQQEQH